MQARRFPLYGSKESIPWALAERAYEKWARQVGGWTLEDLASTGGLMPEEMDAALPDWRREWVELEPRAV